MSDLSATVADLIAVLENHKNPEKALQMSAYMKYQFPFLGLQNQERKKLSKAFIQEIKKGCPSPPFEILNILWELPEREYQYIAMDLLDKYLQDLTLNDISSVIRFIIHKSWWDSVDLLASHAVGTILSSYPAQQEQYVQSWTTTENIWLSRTALLFQLSYKENTNWPLLQHTCLSLKDSEEFFIQKAIGWGLRQYSKVNAEAVVQFTENHKWKPLSKREGQKWLIKAGYL
ncbi:MAG: DNA alkylation repair protein [Bacteroidota bacterium]